MSGADLANLLKNMPSSNLDQLEIMTNPPAKYDASGNSGIINIKTKKNIIKGMNGSLNLGYTQGVYGRTNNGINLNYRNNKVNIFGGYNAGTWEGYNKLIIGRNFFKNGTLDGSSDQVSKPHFDGVYHSMKAGVDYYFSKKDILGVVVNGEFNNGSGWGPDYRSNHFVYEENINAAYIIFSKTIKKWNLITGLRVENTNAKGYQVRNDSSFSRHYTNLFPNLGVGYEVNDKNQFKF